MKYNDLSSVDAEITKNDYVTFDVKQKRSGRNIFGKLKDIKLPQKKSTLLMIPLFIVTVISLGFLIAQLAEYVALTAVANALSSGL